MKSFAYIITLITLLLLSPQIASSNPVFSKISIGQPDSTIPIIESSFHVGIRNSEEKDFLWTKSNLVPLTPDNTCYRWEIVLDTKLPSIPINEIFVLPSEPRTWGNKEDITLLNKNKISVMEKEIEVDNGTIKNIWCVAEGDPIGNYKIEVYINGALAESFGFTVGLK